MRLSKAHLWLLMGAAAFAFACDDAEDNPDTDDAEVSGGSGGGGFGFPAGGGGTPGGGGGGGGDPQAGSGGEEPPPPTGCDAIGEARNMGAPCNSPSDCGDGGVCAANGSGEATCFAKCIPGECTDMCSGDQSCVPLNDAAGDPVIEGGQPVGFCASLEAGDDCMAVMDCIFECEDSACAQECYANGTPTAAAEANELIACIQANYDLCETDACFEDACSEYWHCMPEAGPPQGTEPCNTTWYCILECDNDDAACQQDCINNATPDAYSELMDVFDCAQTAPGDTWHSVAEYCAEEWATCELPEIGDGTCADFFGCFIECETSRCSIDCMLAASEEGIANYNAMIDCADQAGVLDNPEATFGDVAEACPEAWATCGLDAIEYGEDACADIVVCMDTCDPEGPDTCYQDCFAAGSREGQGGYSDAIDCILEVECNAEEETAAGLFNAEGCPECAEVINACLEPVIEPPEGTEDCSTTWYCALECDDDEACEAACMDAATAEALMQLESLFTCAEAADSDVWAGISTECAGEWSACELPTLEPRSCTEAFDCVALCEDAPCILDCALGVDTMEGIEQLEALVECVDAAELLGGTPEEIAEACGDQWVACGFELPRQYGEASCRAVLDCAAACDLADEACLMACEASADEAAWALFDAYTDCFGENQCDPAAGAEGCELCAELYTPCWDDCDVDCEPEPIFGDAACRAVYDCGVACAANDLDCMEACVITGDEEAQGLFNAFTTCATENQCDPAAGPEGCALCADAYGACWDNCDVDCEPAFGDAACRAIFDCGAACAANDVDCMEACVATGDEEAQGLFSAFTTCSTENQCDPAAGPEACALCADAYGACWDNCDVDCEPVFGEDACRVVFECGMFCASDDVACMEACAASGDEEAQGLFSAFTTCAAENQCDPAAGPEGCALCADAYGACWDNCDVDCEPPVEGVSCREIIGCAVECGPQNIPCALACPGTGDAEAQALFQALSTCSTENQCDPTGDPAACVACADPYNACLADCNDSCQPMP